MTNKDINRNPHSRRAFSLYEVAVVIVIIGIFISGIIAADKMVSKFRLAAAKTLATSSPINSIKETALWLETSLDNGFNPSEEEDGATVSLWKDQQNSGNPKVNVVAVGGGPTYANTINRVHAVEFGKSGSAGYLQFNASFLNSTDYTIIILEKRKTAGANYFLKSTDGSNADDNKLNLGYLDDNTVVHSQGGVSYNRDSKVSGYSDSKDKPRLFTFTQSSVEGSKTYINGSLAAEDPTKTAQLSGLTNIGLGKGYTGEIGEIAIFTKALSPEELSSVEGYMSKKWTRSDNRNVAPSCVNSAGSSNYQVTDKGCDLSSADCPISAAGLTATSVSAGSTSRTCDQTANYTGSVIYSACTNGAPVTITTPCTPAAGCSAQSVTGSTTQTTAIAHGSSGSVTCDVAGYSGNTVNYTCGNGSLTPTPTCSCNSAYSGATCNSCALAGFDIAQNCTACLSDYDLVGGICVRKCTTPAATGVTAGTLVPYSPVSQSCNASGYSGSYTYTCSAAGGTAAITSNTCVQQCAVTGMVGTLVTNVNPGTTSLACNDTANHFTGTSTGAYSCSGGVFSLGTAACGCESGYSLVGGVCQQNCTLPNGTLGITDGTTVSSGATFQACNSGTYVGGITYTCTSGSVANITANSCSLPCTASVTPSSYNGKTVFTFLTSGTFSCPTAKNVEVLVVGGGGAGGSSSNEPSAGGGGGGGVVYASAYPIVANTTYNPVIGAGGISATVANAASVCVGRSGQNSTFGTITAIGGGGGGTGYGYQQPSCSGTKNPNNALSGGSGGGGANNNTLLAAPGSSTQTAQTNATNYYGNSGGSIPAACTVNSNNGRCGGAGGGGAGAAGSNATTVAGANGGAGKQIISISSSYYGGGGGGSRAYRDGPQNISPNGLVTIVNYSVGSGGIGGGGAGGVNGGGGFGTVGTPNTGGGGGSNASGGSGIVIIAY